MEPFNDAGLDHITRATLNFREAERQRAGARLLIEEGAAQLAEMDRRMQYQADLRVALQASGSGEWTLAPGVRAVSEALARQWNARSRMTGNSFFWPETLCGERVLTVAGDGGGAVSVAVEHVPSGVPLPVLAPTPAIAAAILRALAAGARARVARTRHSIRFGNSDLKFLPA